MVALTWVNGSGPMCLGCLCHADADGKSEEAKLRGKLELLIQYQPIYLLFQLLLESLMPSSILFSLDMHRAITSARCSFRVNKQSRLWHLYV
jgi:hypothetical protein